MPGASLVAVYDKDEKLIRYDDDGARTIVNIYVEPGGEHLYKPVTTEFGKAMGYHVENGVLMHRDEPAYLPKPLVKGVSHVPTGIRAPKTPISDRLREIAESCSHQPYPNAPLSSEDIEDARHFTRLAKKNDAKTLTTKEAKDILETFEEENVIIIDEEGKRYVDYA